MTCAVSQLLTQHAGLNWISGELRDSSGALNLKTNLVGGFAVFVRNNKCCHTENDPGQDASH